VKLPEYDDLTPPLVLGALIVLACLSGGSWPTVSGVVLTTVLIGLRRMIPDRRAPKVDFGTVLAIQEQLARLQGNVSNLNMVIGIKGARQAPEPPKPPTQ
jgi:hypothetical protein